MADIEDTLRLRGSDFVIRQGEYSLTADALALRGMRPIHAGDDYTFLFTLQDALGVAVDITGAVIKFTAKYTPSDTDGEAIVTKTATLVTPASGIFSVAIADTDLTFYGSAQGVYDIQMTSATGVVTTLVYGPIEFLPNIART